MLRVQESSDFFARRQSTPRSTVLLKHSSIESFISNEAIYLSSASAPAEHESVKYRPGERNSQENLAFSVAALKVKLMLRRPINQLVAQGIMPRK